MKYFVVIYFSLLTVTGLASTTLEFKKGCDCEVTFTTNAESLGVYVPYTTVPGSGGKLVGHLTEDKGKVSGELTVAMEDFKTGQAERDKHMKEDLGVAEYKTATLKIKNLPSGDGEHALVGQLTLHGVTKPIKGTYTLKTVDGKRKLEAKFDVKLSDFKIPRRVVKILKVKETASVEVKAVAE